MAARSIGSLTISFGLVAIPVKLYTATQSSSAVSFNLLHKKDGSRLRQQYVCQKEGVVVERDEIIRGYEFAKDQYVHFTAEEIKALEEVGSRSVEISEFVPIESVDPVFYDKTYYLAPDKGAGKPYALLTEALRQSGRCGVGHWATRGKGYIVILRPIGDVLAMQQLHYSEDVRPVSDVDVPKPEVGYATAWDQGLVVVDALRRCGGGLRPRPGHGPARQRRSVHPSRGHAGRYRFGHVPLPPPRRGMGKCQPCFRGEYGIRHSQHALGGNTPRLASHCSGSLRRNPYGVGPLGI